MFDRLTHILSFDMPLQPVLIFGIPAIVMLFLRWKFL
jgi:hypothetical protein